MDTISKIIFVAAVYWKMRTNKVTNSTNHSGRNKERRKINRRIWVRSIFQKNKRHEQGAGTNLILEMKQQEMNDHFNFFRMSVTAFEHLLNIVGPHINKVDCRREPISPHIRLGITMRYLASGDSMASLSYLFRVGRSTVSEIISKTTEVIWNQLKPLVLQPPDVDKWRDISSGFRNRWNFPNCVGAIDGKHIQIQAPPHSGSEFYNYKGTHSIVLMAVADYKYRFILVDIGATGRQSDGGIFMSSELGKRLRNSQLNLPPPVSISEGRSPMPYVLVGDEAFPLLTNLMRPYSGRETLDIEKRVFNYRLSRSRMVIENAFGILASRWRIFRKPIIGKLENIDSIVKATICLHNYIIGQHDSALYMSSDLIDRITPQGVIIPGAWRCETSAITSISRASSNNYTLTAAYTRNYFADYFNHEGSVPWQWDHM